MKKILLAVLIVTIVVGSGIFYLNSVILPQKIKAWLTRSIEEQIKKPVSLESLQFNIFKGLEFKNLIIYDGQKKLASIKQGSCSLLVLPIFKKMIIIPHLRLNSAEIFIERQKDNAFNVQDLFSLKADTAQPSQEKAKDKFRVLLNKLTLTHARINFQDHTLKAPFTKSVEISILRLNLDLPAKLKFSLQSLILGDPEAALDVTGEFRIPEKQVIARISAGNFAPREFMGYFKNSTIDIPQGLCSGFADIEYGLTDKQFKILGQASVLNLKITGIERIGSIDNISGDLKFDNSGLYSNSLNAEAWGRPVQASLKFNFGDFKAPVLDIQATAKLGLDYLQGILKDKFNFSIPAEIQGDSLLSLDIHSQINKAEVFRIQGILDVSNASLKSDKINSIFQDISGRLEFGQNQLKWSELVFTYLDKVYKTGGVLTNFQAPAVQLSLSSSDLTLDSGLLINQKVITFSRLEGKFLNSTFRITGNIDLKEPPALESDLSGELNLEMQDMQGILKKYAAQLEKIKPQGLANAQFNISGNLADIKSAKITAKLKSQTASFYGLKANQLDIDYNQADGIASIGAMHISLYGGSLDLVANANLNSQNLPFWISADAKDIKIEKLKADTKEKDKDISGTIKGEIKINGFSNDASKLNGSGQIFVSEGKLWQLNLFRGLGSLLFAKDFAHIIFHEASCAFAIQNKLIYTDNLTLKSTITDLSGPVKIGFDNSIEASLNVVVLDEMVPLSGTFKDVTTAIIGEAGRFGVIKISGTLGEPKYRFQPAVISIFQGLKDTLLGK